MRAVCHRPLSERRRCSQPIPDRHQSPFVLVAFGVPPELSTNCGGECIFNFDFRTAPLCRRKNSSEVLQTSDRWNEGCRARSSRRRKMQFPRVARRPFREQEVRKDPNGCFYLTLMVIFSETSGGSN